jgi:hypothetical protein
MGTSWDVPVYPPNRHVMQKKNTVTWCDELGKRRGDERGDVRRSANGAVGAPPQPGVEIQDVEPAVPALRHQSQHLALRVLAEADRAHGVASRGPGEGGVGGTRR